MGFRECKSSGTPLGEVRSGLWPLAMLRLLSETVKISDRTRRQLIVFENQIRVLARLVLGQMDFLGGKVDRVVSGNRVCRRESLLRAIDGASEGSGKRTIDPDREVEIVSVLRFE